MQCRGNVLFLILIAVALFAALGYAVTQSGRSGGGTERETRTLKAAEFSQYFASIEQAVTRLTVTGGCSYAELSFWHDRNGDGVEDSNDLYYNANAPSDRRCHVFSPEGGNVSFRDIQNESIPPGVGGNDLMINFVGTMAVAGLGSDAESELVIKYYTTPEMCSAYNRLLGYPDYTEVYANGTTAPFVGNFTYQANRTIGDGTDPDSLPPRTLTACIQRQESHGQHLIYYVLAVR